MAGWSPDDHAGAKFGINPTGPATSIPSELHAIASPAAGAASESALFHPDNPLLIFGALGAITFGLMAFSTSVRVGSAKAALAVGKQ